MMISEAETKTKHIEPKLKNRGWKEENIEREYRISQNRFYVEGEEYKIKPSEKFADYVLKVNNVVIGVIEAKKESLPAEKGESQAKDYAKRLDVPISYATNGKRLILYDRRIPKKEIVTNYFTPDELYQIYKDYKDLENRNVSPLEHPYYIQADKKIRSYQDTAIKSVLESIVRGQSKILLTMATGTGKTFVSFQIVWKLVKSGYFSRILFLTDRVFLRDQAYENYESFGDSRFEIKSGNFNKNRQVYFSTYQSLYSDKIYKEIKNDFFDLIIIDECHRSRYGDWGNILDHFKTAFHLGMTATPKREDNIDVYEYFGDPVFEYSLAQAIEDGFLVPYKIYKIHLNVDRDGVDISRADEIIYDDDINIKDIKQFYNPSEFERTIILPDRTQKMCEKFLEILRSTNDESKSIIFCVNTIHAENVKDTLNRLTQNEDFATKVVYEDKDDLTLFRDSERKYPLITTTVDLLSTGVDIPHLKNIVFMRPINSTVLFKQIIGRGSRIADNKGFFRIIDFTNSTRLIDEWDIPSKIVLPEVEKPIEPFDKFIKGFVLDEEQNPIFDAKIKMKVGRWVKETYTNLNGYFKVENLPSNDSLGIYISKNEYKTLRRRIKPQINDYIFELNNAPSTVKRIIVSGIPVLITDEIEIEFDGETVAFAEYKKLAKNNIIEKAHNIKELEDLWLNDNKRKLFLDKLSEMNVDIELIKTIEKMHDSDGFDVISHLVFDTPIITRDERVKYYLNHHMNDINQYSEEVREILFVILEKYKKGGIDNLTPNILLLEDMKERKAYSILNKELGPFNIGKFITGIKKGVYKNKITTL
ncbi:EcoAI/FtnUII family type I restriction enzme subunit R [Methanobacterium formicicum]|nr:DEAD/DEAH box helicase family protein [Methanobacterium formicicum]